MIQIVLFILNVFCVIRLFICWYVFVFSLVFELLFLRERERESKKAYDKIGPIQGAKTGFQKWVPCMSPLHHSLTHRLSGLGSRPANSHRGISFGQCFPKYQIYSDGKASFRYPCVQRLLPIAHCYPLPLQKTSLPTPYFSTLTFEFEFSLSASACFLPLFSYMYVSSQFFTRCN